MGSQTEMEMTMACDKDSRTLSFKRGDDFTIDLTVTDENSPDAIVLAEELANLQADLQIFIEEGAVQADIDAAQLLVDSKQNEYDARITVDITGWTITSSIKVGGRPVDDLVVTFTNPTGGTFNLSKGYEFTEDWRARMHHVDVQFDRPGIGRVSSETFYVDVEEDVTE